MYVEFHNDLHSEFRELKKLYLKQCQDLQDTVASRALLIVPYYMPVRSIYRVTTRISEMVWSQLFTGACIHHDPHSISILLSHII